MSEYCEECGEELDQEDEFEGVCKNCKKAHDSKSTDEDFIDPAIA